MDCAARRGDVRGGAGAVAGAAAAAVISALPPPPRDVMAGLEDTRCFVPLVLVTLVSSCALATPMIFCSARDELPRPFHGSFSQEVELVVLVLTKASDLGVASPFKLLLVGDCATDFLETQSWGGQTCCLGASSRAIVLEEQACPLQTLFL